MAKYMRVYANTLTEQESGKFMDADRLRRVTENDYNGALRALKDYGWGDGMSEEATAETLPAYELNKLIEFVKENTVDDKIRDVLLAPYIFHNAKAAYKEYVSGKSASTATYSVGEEVVKAISEGVYKDLPEELRETLTKLSEQENITPSKIDAALTKAEYEYKLRRSRGRKGLNQYVITEIDLKNLLLLKRLRTLSCTQKQADEMYIDGGRLDKSEFLSLVEGNTEAVDKYYALSGYGELFADKSIAETEAGIDAYLYSMTDSQRINYMSDDLFIRYVRRAEAEIRTAHMILVCLKNHAESEIRRRLRPIYD